VGVKVVLVESVNVRESVSVIVERETKMWTVEIKGSAKTPYVLTEREDGTRDCSCVAWKMQSQPIDMRTCKHLVKHLGVDEELARVGFDALPTAVKKKLAKKGTKSGVPVKKSTKKVKKEVVPKEVPELLLAHSWDNDQDVTGYWISEKLDGVRAYWDGKKFVSRLGNVYHAPDYFTEGFPECPLDGELWIGRGRFQETVSVVRRKKGGERWKNVRYLVFDAPARNLGDGVTGFTFEQRMQFVNQFIGKKTPYAEPVKQWRCDGIEHLRSELTRVETSGGEGLMLREPGSFYETSRSTTLLKVKSFVDSEATVIGHTKGRGRHKGRCGALKVRWADGTEFKVGTGLKDAQRENPPKIGAVVCFRYQELTKAGVPRFPSFLGVRHDVEVK
jgi:DNA ligase-1